MFNPDVSIAMGSCAKTVQNAGFIGAWAVNPTVRETPKTKHRTPTNLQDPTQSNCGPDGKNRLKERCDLGEKETWPDSFARFWHRLSLSGRAFGARREFSSGV